LYDPSWKDQDDYDDMCDRADAHEAWLDLKNEDRGSGGQRSYNRSSSEGCFIATAAFGSPLQDEVVVLRTFRDSVLYNFSLGRIFIRFYYVISPCLARFIQERGWLRGITRILLKPLIYLASRLI